MGIQGSYLDWPVYFVEPRMEAVGTKHYVS